ncbi:hypothetical protein MJI95_35345, partial [Salmonella enterica subsp. enterica serovar Kentucky]|nr:hypothetical protein [Salmonella enterica subsp. enterica serovar Kentucky]
RVSRPSADTIISELSGMAKDFLTHPGGIAHFEQLRLFFESSLYTTITRKVQQAAQQAVRNNVLDYDMRHGYRGPANVLWKVGET